MLLSKCKEGDSKRSKFNKEQQAIELVSSLGRRAPLGQIPFVFCFRDINKLI